MIGFVRSLFVLCVLLLLGGLTASHAQSFGRATPGDFALLKTCIDSAGDETQLRACIPIVLRACMSNPGAETTIGTLDCASRSRAAWDRELNDVYRRLRIGATPRAIETLTAAQRAWVVWRDAACAYEATIYEGGSLARVVHASCLETHTAERAVYLLIREHGMEW